jgi:hypothetical protein
MSQMLEEIEVHCQIQRLEEMFGKRKSAEPIWGIINSILRQSIDAVKRLLSKIDFTKEYSDQDIDKLVLALKGELEDEKKRTNSRSGDEITYAYNLGRTHAQGKQAYVGS